MFASVSSVVNVFDATTTSVVAGSSVLDRIVERSPVDVGEEAHVELRRAPAERVDQQRRAKHRPADADVQHAGDRAERARLDRVDQRAHPLAAFGRDGDLVRRAAAALGDMGRRRGPRSD